MVQTRGEGVNSAINGGAATTSGNKRTYVPRRVANARNGGKRARTGQSADVNNNNRVVDDDIEIIEVVTNTVKTCDNFKEIASLVMRVDQVQFVQAHKKLLKKIQSVAMLRDNFKMDFSSRGLPEVFGLRAQQLRRTLDRISPIKSGEKLTTLKELKPFLSKVSYEAPDERIIISWNITRDSRDICPMISDVPEETLDSLEISESSSFSYVHWNRLGNLQAHQEFVRTESEKHAIQCECTSEENMVPCYLNPNCKCSQFNKQLGSLQTGRKNTMSTFDRVLFDSVDHFHDSIAVACSEDCGCRGRCSNNLTFLAGQHLFPTEVFRKDKKIEFRLRALSAIPAGTPFLEFIGDVVPESRVPESDVDYAFQIADLQEEFLKKLTFRTELSVPQRQRFRRLYAQRWYINPKTSGNKARFVSHSCEPNVELVRVFQKSFSPAHIRLFLVTAEDIFPGTELTIDYGDIYCEGEIEEICSCERMSCKNHENVLQVAQASVKTLRSYYEARHRDEFNRFESEVLKRLTDF